MNQSTLDNSPSTIQSKCTGCGADMKFHIETGGIVCSHCGSQQTFDDTEQVQRRKLCDDLIKGHAKWDGSAVFQCSNCGAKEVLEDKKLARQCAFCGAAQVIQINELPGIKPDSVIPFSITEDAAVARFRKWIKSRWFAPSNLKRDDVREKMHKIYTPCWSFSANTLNQYSGTLGRTVTRTVGVGKNQRTQTTTEWFNVRGTFPQSYTDIFFQSGERINNVNFTRLKPFDLKQVKVFRNEYLSGIIAEHYTRNLEQCLGDFSNFIKRDINQSIIRKYRADSTRHLNIHTTYNDRRFNYVLLPIYISNYYYRGKLFNFYVNGATGKVTGRHPKSLVKIWGLVFGIVALVVGAAIGLHFAGIV